MIREKLIKNVWWNGLILLLLLACGLLEMPTSTSAPPTLTSIPLTSTPIPTMSTPIPPTTPPTSPTANVQVEKARAFAAPILAAIADSLPNFEDDFSNTGKGWNIWFMPKDGDGIGVGVIQDGVGRLEITDRTDAVTNAVGAFDNENLNHNDFVMQVDVRFLEGDNTTRAVIIFHISGESNHFDVELSFLDNRWGVQKHWAKNYQVDIAEGRDVSPVGEWTRVLIVARGTQVAVYINENPIAYFDDLDFKVPGHTSIQCQSVAKAVCEYDNVRFWDLAKVPGLP
jgi:3-keto-disaccharide hydrolase